MYPARGASRTSTLVVLILIVAIFSAILFHLRQVNETEILSRRALLVSDPKTRLFKQDKVKDFIRHDNVVIAHMIHGSPFSVVELKQSLCLFEAAYNSRMNYDHVVFTTLELSPENIKELQDVVFPSVLKVVRNSKSLQEEVASLPKDVLANLLKTCNKTKPEELTWDTKCQEKDSWIKPTPISYRWMAEFRSKHIFTHRALATYRYMLWMDSDTFCTKIWDKDPIAFGIRNNVALGIFNIAGSFDKEADILHERIRRAFGFDLCEVNFRTKSGFAEILTADKCKDEHSLPQTHGFAHFTDLRFYHEDQVKFFLTILNEGKKYWRVFDDQTAVMVPAVARAPQRVTDFRSHGFDLKMRHNGFNGYGRTPHLKNPLIDWKAFSENDKNLKRVLDRCEKHAVVNG
jgi:preprotein translocase subunit SecE